MQDVKLGNMSMSYDQEIPTDGDGKRSESLSLSSGKDSQGSQFITVKTEGWTISADKFPEFIKLLGGFKKQAIGK